MKYKVRIDVSEFKDIIVNADNENDAYDIADNMLTEGMVIFDNPDYSDVSIKVESEV